MRYQAVIIRGDTYLSSDYYTLFWAARDWVLNAWIEGDVALIYELCGYEIVRTDIFTRGVWREVVKVC